MVHFYICQCIVSLCMERWVIRCVLWHGGIELKPDLIQQC